MFATMPTPIFSFGHDPSIPPPATPSAAMSSPPRMPASFFRPAVSSPLSSSPIRANSASPPPALADRDPNTLPWFRNSQPSPIKPSQPQPPNQASSKFKYANRNARPNPAIKRREDAQEGRRRLFLQNVRQRADDQKWEMRGGENEILKLEWWRLKRELRHAQDSDIEGFIRDEDIEDEPLPPQQQQQPQPAHQWAEDDDMMADVIAREEAEIEALLETLPTAMDTSDRSPAEPAHFSDEEDYDALFMEFISEQGDSGQDVEMS